MLTGLCAWRGLGRPFPYSFYMLQVEMRGGIYVKFCVRHNGAKTSIDFDQLYRVIPNPPIQRDSGPIMMSVT